MILQCRGLVLGLGSFSTRQTAASHSGTSSIEEVNTSQARRNCDACGVSLGLDEKDQTNSTRKIILGTSKYLVYININGSTWYLLPRIITKYNIPVVYYGFDRIFIVRGAVLHRPLRECVPTTGRIGYHQKHMVQLSEGANKGACCWFACAFLALVRPWKTHDTLNPHTAIPTTYYMVPGIL